MNNKPDKCSEKGMDGDTNVKPMQEKHVVKKPQTKRRYFIVPVVFCHFFTFIFCANTITLFYPVLIRRKLFPEKKFQSSEESVCDTNRTSPNHEATEIIQAEVADMLIYSGLVVGVPSFVANILLGSFSDQFGRKAQLLIPTSILLLKQVMTILFMYYELDINLFLIPLFLEGIVGSLFGVVTVCYSYIADITDNNKHRSIGIAILEVNIGLGALFGALVSGYFIDAAGYIWPMCFASGLMALYILGIIFILPETVQISKDRSIECKTVIIYLKNSFEFYFVKSPDSKRWVYNVCIAVIFLCGMTYVGRNYVETLYAISPPFCWDTIKVGWFGVVRNFVQQIAVMGLLRLLLIFMKDESIAVLGCVSAIVGFVVQGLATNDIMLYISPVVGACSGLTMPMILAVMSKITPSDKQGAMFGGTFAVQTATSSGGTMLFNEIYKETANIHGGIVFFVMASINLLALILLIILAVLPRKGNKAEYKL